MSDNNPFIAIGRLAYSCLTGSIFPSNFLTFLFDDDELIKEMEVESIEDKAKDSYLLSIRYISKASKCKNKLEDHGFNINFFTSIYKFFRNSLRDDVIESLRTKISAKIMESAIDNLNTFSPEEDILQFIDFMRSSFKANFSHGLFKEKYTIGLGLGNEISISSNEYWQLGNERFRNIDKDLINFDRILPYLLQNSHKISLSILMLLFLFDEPYLALYPEIILLMYLCLLLEAVDGEVQILLYINEEQLLENEELIHKFKLNTCLPLIEKVTLYNSIFKVLSENQQDFWELNTKNRCKLLLSQIEDFELNNYAKGQILEEIVELLFATHPMFKVVAKRYVTGDEEIDLVIQNDVDRPFWIALQSPILLFECKNWSKPVGTKELRDFEGKLRNHGNITKIGFFFSYYGFSGECVDELKRMGRGTQLIILLRKEDVLKYINSNHPLIDWLVSMIVSFK